MARRTASPQEVTQWLRDQTPEHLEFLAKMRGRLVEALDRLPRGCVPDRDWARVAAIYTPGFNAVVSAAHETARIALLAAKSGAAPQLADEELDAELRRLGLEAAKNLSTADLATELANRGLTMPTVSSGHEDPD